VAWPLIADVKRRRPKTLVDETLNAFTHDIKIAAEEARQSLFSPMATCKKVEYVSSRTSYITSRHLHQWGLPRHAQAQLLFTTSACGKEAKEVTAYKVRKGRVIFAVVAVHTLVAARCEGIRFAPGKDRSLNDRDDVDKHLLLMHGQQPEVDVLNRCPDDHLRANHWSELVADNLRQLL
jgi:hypothetical protein